MPVRMDNDDLNALMTVGSSGVCAKMLERERATSMGLRRAAGPSGSVAGGIRHCDSDWGLTSQTPFGADLAGMGSPSRPVTRRQSRHGKYWADEVLLGNLDKCTVFPHRHRSL